MSAVAVAAAAAGNEGEEGEHTCCSDAVGREEQDNGEADEEEQGEEDADTPFGLAAGRGRGAVRVVAIDSFPAIPLQTPLPEGEEERDDDDDDEEELLGGVL